MKLFKSSNIELIKECQGYFRCLLPSSNVKERCQKLISKYENSVNTFILCVFLLNLRYFLCYHVMLNKVVYFVNIVGLMLCECT